ncbi:MAG: hypothetical protein Q8K70_05055 [Bacteroidota bacterium]|nr:hypothetical protein [Bacteroidota bacterium]
MVTFNRVPGMVMPQYPEELFAEYQLIQKSNGIKDTHRFIINKNGIQTTVPVLSQMFNFSDSNLVISHYGHFYFLSANNLQADSLSHWLVFPFQYDKNHLYLHKITLDKKTLRQLRKSGLKNNGTSSTEFILEDENFKRYCNRYLKKRKSTKFKRIK